MRSPKKIDLLSREQVEALIAACGRRSPTGIRNRALIALLYGAGLRLSEALAIETKDIDLTAGIGHVVGKGGKTREFALSPLALDHLDLWLAVRAQRGLARACTLICTLDGRHVSDRYVRAMLARKAAAAGIDARVTPHALRHSHAAELDRRGASITDLAAQLGHGSLSTTQRYVRKLQDPDRLRRLQALLADEPEGGAQAGTPHPLRAS